MTATTLLIAILFGVFGVMLPGKGIASLLTARRLINISSEPAARLLVNFSFGVQINALVFLVCWVAVPAEYALSTAVTLLAAVGVTAAFVIWRSRSEAWTVDRSLCFVLILGAAVGLFAAFNFPNTLDSLQVLLAQQYILGTAGGQVLDGGWIQRVSAFFFGGTLIPAQSGFAGLLFIPSLLQLSLPVATVSAGNKVLLLALAATVALYSARQLKSPAEALAAVLIFAIFVVSQFGLNGIFLTGKDSIFSVLMSVATISALASIHKWQSDEPGIFMSAGILLGAVAVPYLLVFWAIFFLCAPRLNLRTCLRQAWWCLAPLTLTVISVRESFPQPGALKIHLAVALVVGIAFLAALSWVVRKAFREPDGPREQGPWIAALIPVTCVVAVAFLLPVAGGILEGRQVGSPLDGKTTAFGYAFKMAPRNNVGITALCLLVMCLGPLLSKKLRSSWSIALLGFLPVTSLFAFAHIKFNWHLLPLFNLWDISRDTMQWYAGAIGGLVPLAAALLVLEGKWKRWIALSAIVATFVFTTPWNFRHFVGPWTNKPTMTASGGSYEPASAKAFDLIWRKARGWPVYADTTSRALNDQFYSFQMFGPASVEKFSMAIVGAQTKQMLLLNEGNVPPVLSVAAEQKMSGWVRPLARGAYAVALIKDGQSHMDTGDLPRFAVQYSGAYDSEQFAGVAFRWMNQQSTLHLYRMDKVDKQCIDLKFVSARPEPRQKITIASGSEERTFDLPPTASMKRPHAENICLKFDQTGVAQVNLIASEAGTGFPGDSRVVAFGLLEVVE